MKRWKNLVSTLAVTVATALGTGVGVVIGAKIANVFLIEFVNIDLFKLFLLTVFIAMIAYPIVILSVKKFMK